MSKEEDDEIERLLDVEDDDEWDGWGDEDWEESCEICLIDKPLSDVCPECGFGVCQSCRKQLLGPCDCGEFTWK
jgi:hypothetical protein